MRDIQINRPTLGEFMSVTCFRYLSEDAEELAGRALVIDAGRQRGSDVIEQMGLKGSHESGETLQQQLDDVFGVNGTRLCMVKQVRETDEGGFEVHVEECASVPYTQGVLLGAISAITGKTILSGDSYDTDSTGHIYHFNIF